MTQNNLICSIEECEARHLGSWLIGYFLKDSGFLLQELTDPSGNSFVENIHAPKPDPAREVSYFVRSTEQVTRRIFIHKYWTSVSLWLGNPLHHFIDL